jgi:pantothenate kinase type III
MLTLDGASLLPGVNFKVTNLRYRTLQVPEVNIRIFTDVEAELSRQNMMRSS